MQLTYRLNRPRAERGAVAPIVAILMATGVVTGLLALTVDIGNIQWERRQLQNGADAAAMALAAQCATDDLKCNATEADNELDGLLLNPNAADKLAQFDKKRADGGVCGSAASGITSPCPEGSFEDLAACTPRPEWLVEAPDIPYVETYTRTETDAAGDNTILPKFFSQTLTGDTNASVSACARAAWGTPAGYKTSVPLTLSACEFAFYTDPPSRHVYEPPGPTGYGPGAEQVPYPPETFELTALLHSANSKPPPNPDPNHPWTCHYKGKDADGGFGYLDTPSDSCEVEVSDDDWAQIKPGNSVQSCIDAFKANHEKIIVIPIFDCLLRSATRPEGPIPAGADCTGADAGGNKSWYHIKGWASFYLSGYKLGGVDDEKPSDLSGKVPCSGGDRCLSGWFVNNVLEADQIVAPGGDSDFGTIAIKLAG